jgi:hypothetical protein
MINYMWIGHSFDDDEPRAVAPVKPDGLQGLDWRMYFPAEELGRMSEKVATAVSALEYVEARTNSEKNHPDGFFRSTKTRAVIVKALEDIRGDQ